MRRGRVFFETMPCGAFFVQIFMQKCESRLGERGVKSDSERGQRLAVRDSWSVIRGQWSVVSDSWSVVRRIGGDRGGAHFQFRQKILFTALSSHSQERKPRPYDAFPIPTKILPTGHCSLPCFSLEKTPFRHGKKGLFT